ncbi:MAG: PadR family transcriptional regulator [Acidimicrobiia bacterium]
MSVPHALLALLTEGPSFGLRLRQEFEARTGEVWPLNVGQVYSTLQRLERDGLVEADQSDSDADGPQKRYRITESGQHELTTWLRTPPDTSIPPRDELVIKVLIAARLPGADIREIVQSHRHHFVAAMQRCTQIKARAAEDDVELALVADAELFRLDAIVRWLDAAEARLARTPLAPRPPTATASAPQPNRSVAWQ